MTVRPPSIDLLLRSDAGRAAVSRFGHGATVAALRSAADRARSGEIAADAIAAHALAALEHAAQP
jgi:hypothetical protein